MRKRLMRYVFAACCLLAGAARCHAAVVSFGSGTNTFNIEFVTIGNPGNAADTRSASRPVSATLGAVGYTYGIGKFEVSRDMITKFNASQSLQIYLEDMTSFGGNGANKPATGVSWNAAARFVNWLNTSSGGFAAYKFTTDGVNHNISSWTASDTDDYNPLNPYRSTRATYALPSYNEWYKAAYYNPSNSTYYDFPNGSNTAPDAVASGTATNTAVFSTKDIYGNIIFAPSGLADVDQAGGLSPTGVMGLGGNVYEWEESPFDLANSSGSSYRGIRGGDWANDSSLLASSSRIGNFVKPSSVNHFGGFRVVTMFPPSAPPAVPEPSMMVIGTLFGIGGLVAKRRMKK